MPDTELLHAIIKKLIPPRKAKRLLKKGGCEH